MITTFSAAGSGGDAVHRRILAEKADDRLDRSRAAAETTERVARALPKQGRVRNLLRRARWAGWDA